MSASYVTGNWSIEPLYHDSITTPKTLSLPDFSWATDWHEAYRPSGRTATKDKIESYFGNVTGPTVDDVEHLMVQYREVSNVYADLPINIDSSAQADQKSGRSVYRQFVSVYKATNSVSGQELYLPCKGAITLTFPASPLVQSGMVEDFMTRLISSLLATGETDSSLLLQELRRDLDPTR